MHERALSSGNLMESRFSAFFMRYGVIFNMFLQLDVCMYDFVFSNGLDIPSSKIRK